MVFLPKMAFPYEKRGDLPVFSALFARSWPGLKCVWAADGMWRLPGGEVSAVHPPTWGGAGAGGLGTGPGWKWRCRQHAWIEGYWLRK